MSASQFPLHCATVVTAQEPTINAGDLQHVTIALRRIELLVDLAVNPLLPAYNQRQLMQAAQDHLAGLVAYTQPWVEIGGWPAASWPSPWRP